MPISTDLASVFGLQHTVFPGPAPKSAIDQAEHDLGIKFPPDYRYILKNWGALLAPGLELYGIMLASEEPPLFQSVVAVNKALRLQGQIGTERPHHFAIADDGMGSFYFMVGTEGSTSPVYAIGPYHDYKIATDLTEFVHAKLNFSNDLRLHSGRPIPSCSLGSQLGSTENLRRNR